MPASDPLLLSRIVTLLASLAVSLVSGTNYAVGAWAPAVKAQLGLSSTAINLVGVSGNLGVYLLGPLFGMQVDRSGPRANLLSGSVLIFLGYMGIRAFYIGQIAYTGSSSLVLLCIFTFLTGAGSTAGLSGGLNTAAKSFPDKTRASATGLVLAGFGLSAFLFSSISHALFPTSTADFLLLLACGCGAAMLVGALLVRPVPHVHIVDAQGIESDGYGARESGWERIGSLGEGAYVAIPDSDDEDASESRPDIQVTPPTPLDMPGGGDVLNSPVVSCSPSPGSLALKPSVSRSSGHTLLGSPVNISGLGLVRSLDFWILTTIVSLLSGTGLMWINNCGTATLALFSAGIPEYDRLAAAKLQATQVSVISVWNCSGRILIGIATDLAKTKLHIRRVHFMCLVALVFILSQLVAAATSDVSQLWITSSLLGLGYGGLFGLAPIIALELFGMESWSMNWGFVSMSPILGSNILNLLFGRIYDSHSVKRAIEATQELLRRGGAASASGECYEGLACYRPAFYVTTSACTLALALSLFAGWRRERAGREREKARRALGA